MAPPPTQPLSVTAVNVGAVYNRGSNGQAYAVLNAGSLKNNFAVLLGSAFQAKAPPQTIFSSTVGAAVEGIEQLFEKVDHRFAEGQGKNATCHRPERRMDSASAGMVCQRVALGAGFSHPTFQKMNTESQVSLLALNREK